MIDEHIVQALKRWAPRKDPERMKLYTDCSDFFRINSGDLLQLEGDVFLVGNNTREGRFGLDDEVKYWVKRGLDLQNGKSVVLKLEFHERFDANIGGVRFECFRSPKKESRILDMVHGKPAFMQGRTYHDEKGNNVRVLDFIRGKPVSATVTALDMDHETFFHTTLPDMLDHFIGCVEAIRFLHDGGEKHGDIRRDHILIDNEDGHWRWIDFDYSFLHKKSIYAYDLYGLGNVLTFIAGKGDVNPATLQQHEPEIFDTLYWEDLNVVWQNRVSNLKKVYPYIPKSLNDVMLHFSNGSNRRYEITDEFLSDLKQGAEDVRSAV